MTRFHFWPNKFHIILLVCCLCCTVCKMACKLVVFPLQFQHSMLSVRPRDSMSVELLVQRQNSLDCQWKLKTTEQVRHTSAHITYIVQWKHLWPSCYMKRDHGFLEWMSNYPFLCRIQWWKECWLQPKYCFNFWKTSIEELILWSCSRCVTWILKLEEQSTSISQIRSGGGHKNPF